MLLELWTAGPRFLPESFWNFVFLGVANGTAFVYLHNIRIILVNISKVKQFLGF
jgi:hypothetical protein